MELIKIKFFVFAFAASFLISCKDSGKTVDSDLPETAVNKSADLIVLTKEQLKNAGIVLASPELKMVTADIRVSGILDVPPQNLFTICAKVNASVKKTSMLQGSHVHKGEVLCVLESPDFIGWQQDYAGNRARLEFLESDLKRQSGLAEKNIASVKVFEQAKADFRILDASQKGLKKRLELLGFSISEIEKGNFSAELPVIAPIDGFVTSVFVNTGQVLTPENPVCEIVNMDHIHAELMVFEKDVTKVKEGQEVDFELVSEPGKFYKAKVFLVNHKISRDRTVQVHAHIEKILPEFIPNMQVSAKIRTDAQQQWVLPSEAILSDGSSSSIYVSDAGTGKFQNLKVEILRTEGDISAIRFPEGIEAASLKVVVKGAYDIRAVAEKNAEAEE
jgi:cobalt-zinc-cadmium efflux system membrane fusion protein